MNLYLKTTVIIALTFLTCLATQAHAMLYCANFPDGSNIAYWSVGQPLPPAWDDLSLTATSLSCGATGKELKYIQDHFQGIKNRTFPNLRNDNWMYWDGDDAVFIASNL